MFSFGHCPNRGGGPCQKLKKNIIYIFIFDGRKRCTSCPKEGEGGGGGGRKFGQCPKENIFFAGKGTRWTLFEYSTQPSGAEIFVYLGSPISKIFLALFKVGFRRYVHNLFWRFWHIFFFRKHFKTFVGRVNFKICSSHPCYYIAVHYFSVV